MVEKFNPTSDTPKMDRVAPIGPGGGEDLDVEEVGQEIELDQPKRSKPLVYDSSQSSLVDLSLSILSTSSFATDCK